MEHILNQKGHFNRTDKYKVVTSQDLITYMQGQGYTLTDIQASQVRTAHKEGFQKHLMRFCRNEYITEEKQTELRPEIVIMNSYDGSQSIRIMLGMFRLVCSNGLVVGSSVFTYRIPHLGDVQARLKEALTKSIKAEPYMFEQVNKMKELEYNNTHASALKKETVEVLVTKKDILAVNAKHLDARRRWADRAPDLFTGFNRVQENAMLGNIDYLYNDKNGEPRWRKCKRVKSIDKQIELNQRLWNAAVSFVS